MSHLPRILSSVPPASTRPPRPADAEDAYAELLSQTRRLRREEQAARDAWYATLDLDRKEDVLFEFEILLKGLACFSNPRNHPGPARRSPIVAVDFSNHLALWREGVARVVHLARYMLGHVDRSLVFQRYLETILPEDISRSRLVRGSMSQDSPNASLFLLRQALTQTLEVSSGIARLSRVPYRLFYALLSSAQREIAHNAHFNPLSALEFRPEFDKIESVEILKLMGNVPGRSAHRLVALTFLSLFRMLRYLRLVDSTLASTAGENAPTLGRTFLVLAVLRSDARALSGYLGRSAGLLLAESFESDLLALPAAQLREQHDSLASEARRLIAIRTALEGIAANLRLEMRRSFEHELPGPDSGLTEADIRDRLQGATGDLRTAIESAMLFLGKALGGGLSQAEVFSGVAERETSERLRRDIWMFAQIVRAFATKAAHARSGEDRWGAAFGFAFVKEFLTYFQALGYPLLRAADYPRLDAFLSAMAALEDADLFDPRTLEPAIAEATAFHDFLLELFDEVSKRDELRDVPFDKRVAAQALKLYLRD